MNNRHAQSPLVFFWFGALAGGSLLYFLGTKKGREFAHKALDVAEHLDEHIADAASELSKEYKDIHISESTVSDVLSKIKSVLPHEKDVSKRRSVPAKK